MATKRTVVPAGPVKWTKTRERTFLEHLALSSNVAASERVALVPPGAAYKHRIRSADFRRNWEVALTEGYARLELAMLESAINGVTLSLDDGARWQAIGGTAAPAIMGQAATVLAPGSTAVRDEANGIDILLLNDTMALVGSDATGLSANANLALLGDELIQFASAAQVGPRLFRLTGLLRGRRGSEWAMGGHAIGEPFVLIDPDTLLAWPLPLSAIGRPVRVSASGVGDSEAAEAQLTFQARAMRPPAPVALHGTAMPDGSVSVGWTRRSRAGWDWLDDTDAPLAEEAERYQAVLSRSGGVDRSLAVAEATATIAPADLAALGGTGPLTIAIAQIGTTAASLPPAILTMTLGA